MSQRRIPQEWLDIAKQQIKECTTKRLYLRIEQLRLVINKTLPSNLPRFIIDESLKNQICNQVLNVIDEYQGFKINNNKFPKSQQEVIKKTRTWWNRIKSSKLASLLFLVICFYVLYNFLEKKCSILTPLKRITLFIDLFIGFQHELIKFPKTKPKSLIPHQCFLAQSDFKDLCSAFIEIFGDDNIKWDCNIKRVGVFIENGKKNYKYIKEKK